MSPEEKARLEIDKNLKPQVGLFKIYQTLTFMLHWVLLFVSSKQQMDMR